MARAQRRRTNAGASLEMAQFLDAGVNKIKKRIRDIERLLKKKGDILPDTVIVEKERTLEALKLELNNAHIKQKVKKNAKKYHMIRFFERKKAMRKYKKAIKSLEEDPTNKTIEALVTEAKLDLCYVVNFPKSEKYIALYPNVDEIEERKDTSMEDNNNLKKKTIYDLITKQFNDNTLPVSLEDILEGKKLERDNTGVVIEEHSDNSSKARKNNAATKDIEEEEEEDDFFE